MQRLLRTLVLLLAFAFFWMSAAPARALVPVEDAARQATVLSDLREHARQRRDALVERNAWAAIGWYVPSGGEWVIERIAWLDARIARLDALLEDADVRLTTALSAGLRHGPFPDDVERWRDAVEASFAPHRVEEALAVIACESGGEPDARNRRSGAAGLFQFLRGTWRWVAGQLGSPDASPTAPRANIAAAAWLVRTSEAAGIDPWAHWSCRP